MTTLALTPTAAPTQGSRLRRFVSLVRAETTILLRNRTAIFTAVALPLVMAFAFSSFSIDGMSLGAVLTMMLICTSLLFVVYFTLVTSLVARREQHTLKRLFAGEPTPLEILLAPAVPLWGLLVIQSLLGVVGAVLLGTSIAHPAALVLAVVGGTTAWTALAVISASWTRTVESAQLTTMPLMMVSILFSGFSIPLEFLPEMLQTVAHWLPMTPVIDLVTLAYACTGIDGTAVVGIAGFGAAALQMLLPLAFWTAAAMWLGLRTFRWDARS
ncbi:MAG: ABC transporter permease [Tessaracoccus sp.]